jgi:Zn-dependent peptidase ImmA (M78 family)
VPSAVDRSNHPIRAYLIARAGKGIIFIDGTDSADEQRFSLAHEVAHFLLDYLQPREEALKSFGEEILAVLDGNRSPTADERLKGIFRSIKLGTYSHLIDRSADGKVEKIEILQTEDNADLLALELLAPKRTVLHRMEDLSIRWKEDSAFQSTRQVLVKEFGLPLSVARSYANLLVLCKRPAPSMKEWLGL